MAVNRNEILEDWDALEKNVLPSLGIKSLKAWINSATFVASFENNEDDLQKFVFTKINGFLTIDDINNLMPGGKKIYWFN
jgi:hypothetical protein